MTIVEAARRHRRRGHPPRCPRRCRLDPVGGLLGTEDSQRTPPATRQCFRGWRVSARWQRSAGRAQAPRRGPGPVLATPGHTGPRGRPPEPPGAPAQGRSDPIDAVEAARATLAGRAGEPKSMDGAVEAIRVLVIAKRSARQARSKALTQMRHLSYTAPDELRCRLKGLSIPGLVAEAASLRPIAIPTRSLQRPKPRSRAWGIGSSLDTEIAGLDELIGAPPLCHRARVAGAPRRRTRHGCLLAHHCRRQP